MSWSPNDLVSDADLVAYEANILTQFGQYDWTPRRSKALEDWLFPLLIANGFQPHRLRTRFTADQVWGYTGGAYADVTDASKDGGEDDINAAAVFATPSTDALLVGSVQPFRGLSIRMLDNASSATAQMTVTLWTDYWQEYGIEDGTIRVAGKTLSGGGAVMWTVPGDWVERPINSSPSLFYARLKLNAVPTGAQIAQIGVIRRSLLCAAATLRTLCLIYHEAPTSQDGPWREKAEWYETQADEAFQRVKGEIGGEFDTITVDDVVDATEQAQTVEMVTAGGWSLERG
jgi:hypothetical protein